MFESVRKQSSPIVIWSNSSRWYKAESKINAINMYICSIISRHATQNGNKCFHRKRFEIRMRKRSENYRWSKSWSKRAKNLPVSGSFGIRYRPLKLDWPSAAHFVPECPYWPPTASLTHDGQIYPPTVHFDPNRSFFHFDPRQSSLTPDRPLWPQSIHFGPEPIRGLLQIIKKFGKYLAGIYSI